ncbi:unnamed protein product [Miscanthus lutarioriparius]|uniref:UDP-glucose 4,6-dehydratase n=1 Tax=Miscanthus lutarioriparius TaxID=422564 RepID=A0A811ME01_9POAL|nr:unnamed protein product [Miscanthus lutarioriparius]
MATYEPKNILITGAAGFIASHVANRLVRNYLHYKIVVLDKLDYCSSLKNLNPSRASPNLKFVKGDIASADLVNHLLVTESIDTIMHFAAQTHVDNSFGNSFEFTKNNIYGTHIRRFIHVSTDEVYGETDEDAVVGNHEASQLLPTNPYSATKAGAEMLVMAYGRSYGLPVITTRGNNVYGPNQFPEKLIPKFILLAMRGLPFPIHGDGSNVRSYLYCEDVAEAFEVVLHKGEVGHVYNIGTVKERRVIDVAKDICRLFGLDTEKVIRFVENRPFNDQRYFLDDQKLKRLGWAECTPWEEGLKKTIEWYTTNPDYWGDVTGALLPHPRMLMTPGVERHNWTEEIKSLTSSPAEASTTAPATSTKRTTEKPLYKFLIYGRTGWIGGLLGKICDKQGIPYEYGKGRLEERSQLLEDIRNVKPTHVFNAAGVTGRPNVDWCETHKQHTIRTNVVGTLNLADVCHEQGLLMINYATGCIFEYDCKHPEGSGIGFKEEDMPNFTGSFYSKTKAMVEELLKEYDNVCTLRVRMPISSDLSNPRNFITKIARYDKVVNIPNSVTILDELLPISIDMAKRDCRGIWNFTNPGVVGHNEILEMYKKYISADFKWINFTLEEQAKVIVAPRSNNEMDALKLKAEFPQLLSIKDSLIKYVFEPNRKKFVYGVSASRSIWRTCDGGRSIADRFGLYPFRCKPETSGTFLGSSVERLFVQFPNLDPNPSAHPARWAAAPVRGTAAAAGDEARRSGGGRWAGDCACARHWRRQPAGSGLGPRRERLLRCAGPGLPAAACWRDETYEGIEAPHWADLTDPNAGRADVDDKAWDGSSNLKWQGGGAVASSTPPKPKAAPNKRFQEDSENQDPALATPPPRQAPTSRPPFGAPRWNKNAKEAIKSSAEKRPDNSEKEALLNKYAPPRQLKSTLSARNLFFGKDILGQISEFYDELKRMVGGGWPVTDTQEEYSSNPMNPSDLMEKVSPDASVSNPVPADTVKEVARQETVKKSPSPMKGKKVGLKVEAGKQRSPSVLKEVKATPLTPQRFPSPSPNRIKNVKPGGVATAGSPLKKPLKVNPAWL